MNQEQSEAQLRAISPVDGRYHEKTKQLSDYFSEFALIRYRVRVEIEYFIALTQTLSELKTVNTEKTHEQLRNIYRNFTLQEAIRIKEIESITNHDVKAVEYLLKEEFDTLGLTEYKEYIHFGLTSQDINNTAVPLSIKEALDEVYLPALNKTIDHLSQLAEEWKSIPMLARTHGQPASPTRLGKEIEVFVYRLEEQLKQLKSVPISGKFGGATGNFNAHNIAYPNINWKEFGNKFLTERLHIQREQWTTQISNYDNLAAGLDAMRRINIILMDFCRDIWHYISIDYFKQKIRAGEVGSSAMPHKVNPIDYENAEGNLGIANTLLDHLAMKLPISRLQRDLTDSTVLRNIGMPFAHTIIALASIEKGLNKLLLHEESILKDLENNLAVVAEAIQTVLRREGYPKPYEALKELTRTNEVLTRNRINEFIDGLTISNKLKQELKEITPLNYTGI